MVEATRRAQLSSRVSGWRGGLAEINITLALQAEARTEIFFGFLWVDMVLALPKTVLGPEPQIKQTNKHLLVKYPQNISICGNIRKHN